MNIKQKNIHPVFNDLAQAVGDFMAYWGFSETDGKIWTYVYLNNGPVETPDIIDFVQKSKASVSISITKLLKNGLIEKQSLGKAGTVSYSASKNVSQTIFSVLRTRELKLLVNAKESVELLKDTQKLNGSIDHISQDNLKDLEDMICLSHKALKLILSMDKQTISGFNSLMRRFVGVGR